MTDPLIDQPQMSPPGARVEQDLSNPPLRRMRTSLVNRRRMEEIQQRANCQKYLDQQVGDCFKFGMMVLYYTICYFLPAIFGGERDAECTMNTALSNALFGWVLVGAQFLAHLAFIIGYYVKASDSNVQVLQDYVQNGVMVVGMCTLFISLIGWAIWFAWSQVLWADISSGPCLKGWQLFDFINWLMILVTTVWSAITVAIGSLICLCCAPCIIGMVREYLNQQNEGQAERNGVVDAIVKSRYNAEDFKEHKECAVCLMEFGADEEVTPLPCNTQHYFHSECITQWLRTNNTCPMCRAVVNAQGFEELQGRLGLQNSADNQV